MTILEKIVAAKRQEVRRCQELVPVKNLEKSELFKTPTRSMSQALISIKPVGVIAEIKRKSPSKGVFKEQLDIEKISSAYINSGAAALSVLTDWEFFGGSTQDLILARQHNSCPILRKDFIVSEYQVIEAKSIGADTVLLLANVLSPQEIRDLAKLARDLTMEVLLEVHDEQELNQSLNDSVNLVGVNNRDLRTFAVDVQRSFELAEKIPANFVKVSESGLDDCRVISQLHSIGFSGFLIGEAFMKCEDPAMACAEFLQALKINLGERIS